MLQNKKFQSNETQEVVMITGDNGVFYSLSNGANIKKDIFFQKYSEMVDASSFFEKQTAAGLAQLVEQAKTLDSKNAVDGNIAPSVKYLQEVVSEQVQPPAEYKEMLLKKFQYEQAHKDLSQYKVFENEEEAADDWERKIKQQQAPQPQRQRPRQDDGQWQQYQPDQQSQQQQPVMESMSGNLSQTPSYVSPEEEAFKFFRSFKKIYPITLSVDFEERIAEPNFIKMMAMNYEGDIIKFYTKEFMNRIYNDPGFLENKIYEKLRTLVFEEDQKKTKSPRSKKAKEVVDVKKPTPTPKKRTVLKKETVQNG